MRVKHSRLFYRCMRGSLRGRILIIPSVYHTNQRILIYCGPNQPKIEYSNYINNNTHADLIFINRFYNKQYIIIIIFNRGHFKPN